MKYSYYIVFLLAILFLPSCVKRDEYKKYLKGGELIYPARPDSIIAHPGKGRVILSWILTGDPNLVQYKIFWNRGMDSIEQNIKNRIKYIDTIKVLIDKQVSEGTYTFTIYSFDNTGHRSIPSEITAKTYGRKYQDGLPGNRKISKITSSSDSIFITWERPPKDNIFTNLRYITVDNKVKTIRIVSDSLNTILLDYKFSSDILYKSAFIPDSNAIDTFYIPTFDTTRVIM